MFKFFISRPNHYHDNIKKTNTKDIILQKFVVWLQQSYPKNIYIIPKNSTNKAFLIIVHCPLTLERRP